MTCIFVFGAGPCHEWRTTIGGAKSVNEDERKSPVRPSIGSSVIAVCGTVAALVAVAPASASTALTHSSAATPNHATAFPAAASGGQRAADPRLPAPRAAAWRVGAGLF